MSQFVYQGPMGQGGESRALAQDQYEEDQRMLNKSQQREKYNSTVPGYDDEEEQFAPMGQSPVGAGRRGTVLRVSSAQKKRPPAQGVQGYEEDDSQRPTLKYDNAYPQNQPADPFNPEYSGVAPYRKASQRLSDMPRSDSTGQFTRPKQSMPSKISNYGPIRIDDEEDDQYNPMPQQFPDNSNVSRFARPMPANRQQQLSQDHGPQPVHSKFSPRRHTEQKPQYDGLLSPQQNDDLIRHHEKQIQDEIQQLQNESRTHRQKSSPRNHRKSSPIRNKYMEDQMIPQNYNEIKEPSRRPMTDVKSIKVTKSRSGSNVRPRPQDPPYRQINPYNKPLKVINARVEPNDTDIPENAFRPQEAHIQESPRMKAYNKNQQPFQDDDDVLSLQDQINRDYENKLKEVNDEAVNRLKEVQEEHRKILAKTQELYSKKKEVDDLERQFNNMKPIGHRSQVPLHDPIIQVSGNQSINTQQMSFLNASGRPERQPSADRPYYVKSAKPQRNRDRDDSRNTFQMLNDLSDYERSNSRGRFSRMSQGMNEYPENNFGQNFKGNNAGKLKDLYKEFCDSINNNKQKNYRHQNDICLHDVISDMHLIGPDTDDNLQRQVTEGTENTAISTENVKVQKQKFLLPLRNEAQHFDEHAKEDVLKNLFKILCGIMNMGLKQRGINMIDTQILRQYLDSINFNIQDNDLILLNQLAAIKGLANRKAFSLSEQQLSMIHIKFKNLYQQRNFGKEQMPPYQQQPYRRQPNYDQGTIIMPKKSDIDHRYTPVQVKSSPRRNTELLPRELQYHELEESRDFREGGGYKPHRVKSKPYASAVDRMPQPRDEDSIERYRPQEYRPKPVKKQMMDSDTDEGPGYDNFKPQRHGRPSRGRGSSPEHDPYYQPEKPYRKSQRPPMMDDEDPRYSGRRPEDDYRRGMDPRGPSRSNSQIGRGSHLAPDVSPGRQKRGVSPHKLGNIQDFLNSKPAASNNKRPNPNQSGIGRQFRDTSSRSGLKDPRYDDFGSGRSPGRGGRDRDRGFRSPDSAYSGNSGYRGMSHGGYNM